MLATDVTDALLIAGFVGVCLILVALPEIFYERFDRRRHPEREAQRLKYKPVWKILSVLTWNGGVIGALLLRGDGAAALSAVLLLAAFGVFRLFLIRSPAMQRRFLAAPPYADASSQVTRNI